MELHCELCQKTFVYTGRGQPPKFCPACRARAYARQDRQRNARRQAAKHRHKVLHPGPAHRLDLNSVLRDLDRFNALRRAEGHSAVSYGRYVALRDKYLHLSD